MSDTYEIAYQSAYTMTHDKSYHVIWANGFCQSFFVTGKFWLSQFDCLQFLCYQLTIISLTIYLVI